MTQAEPHSDQTTQVAGILNAANVLTGVRVLLVPLFGWLLLSHPDSVPYRIATVVVFVVASVTDRIDGELARRHGLVTEVGKMADPIADKALMGMALIGLSLLDELPWWVTVVMLVREVGITVLRFVVLRRGVIPASRGGKVKTMVQAVAIGLYLLPLPGGWHVLAQVVMAVALVLTVVTGFDYVLSAVARSRGRRS
jgi:CDP-diacylglycerol---glycerol-3-phosphate 3-phosphatidyltransferase